MTAPLTVLQSRYAPAVPVDLVRTLTPLQRGRTDPTTRWTATGFWRAVTTPLGAATLNLAAAADGAIAATAWGPGAASALDGVPELLGSADDWSDVDVSANAGLAEVRRRCPGLRLTRTRRVLDALIPAIIEQKITSQEAFASWAALVRRHGDPAPGPAPAGMHVCPPADTWRQIPSWEWHRAGVDPRRSRTVLAAVAVASSLERTLNVDPGEASRRLQSLPGIGPWTSAETLQRSHGAPDAVSVGDYHLAHTVGMALAGRRVDDDGMLELLQPWEGHRHRVIRLILASGYRPPRFGPRMTIQDHRHH